MKSKGHVCRAQAFLGGGASLMISSSDGWRMMSRKKEKVRISNLQCSIVVVNNMAIFFIGCLSVLCVVSVMWFWEGVVFRRGQMQGVTPPGAAVGL